MLYDTYTASGRKIRQQLVDREGRISTQRDYAGSFVYVNNDLAWVNTTHGRIFNKRHGSKGDGEYVKELHLRDHLGNTRATLTRQENLEYILTNQTDYYPFGLAFYDGANHRGMSLSQNRYLYNGKELQDDFGLNWYDYGARFYDPQIARWHSVDPLAEKYFSMSPYNYVGNNPVMRIDPDGRSFIGGYGTVNNTGSAEVTIYSGEGYAERYRDASGNPNLIVNIDGVQYNSPPGTSGGSSRRLGTGVNDELPPEEIEEDKELMNNEDATFTLASLSVLENSLFYFTGISTDLGQLLILQQKRHFNYLNRSRSFTGINFNKELSFLQRGSKLLKNITRNTFILGGAIDFGIGVPIYYYDSNNPFAVSPINATINLSVATYSLYVSPPVGILYFGIDLFYPGGWKGAMKTQGNLIRENQKILGPGWNMYKKN